MNRVLGGVVCIALMGEPASAQVENRVTAREVPEAAPRARVDRALALSAAPIDRISWQGVVGVDRLLRPESFLGISRCYLGRAEIGLDFTDLQPPELTPFIGRFSGEQRWIDFEGRLSRVLPWRRPANPPGRGNIATFGPRKLDGVPIHEDIRAKDGKLLVAMERRQDDFVGRLRDAVALRVDQIWLTPQWVPESANAPFGLMDKKGAYFKDHLYEAVRWANTGEFASKPIEVYWEIGNEINTPDRFSVRDHGPESFNPANAIDYAEYYLAPAVEAIRTASREIYGDERRIKIISGSVSGILKPRAMPFLDAMLNHTIRGDHAPSLAGKKAYELIDVVSVHYTNGEPGLVRELYDTWIASGKVKGLWSTEENGWRGLGDYNVALVNFRWLSFWANRPWSPLATRVISWGTEKAHYGTSTKGDGMEHHLGTFFQNFPLTAVDDRNELRVQSGGDPELLALRADLPDGRRRYGFLVHARPAAQMALGWIDLKPVKSTADVRAWRLPRDREMEPIQLTGEVRPTGFRINFENWELRPDEMLLVFVETPPTAKK